MFDLDNFKSINDRFGHEGGDAVLIESTTLMRDQLRNYDILGRLGGEEFAVLLPETGITEAVMIANRMLDHLRAYRFEAPLESLQVTSSIGAVEIDDGIEDLEQMIRLADKKLYQAKNEGKDTVRF